MSERERAIQILCEAYWGQMLKVYRDGDQCLFLIAEGTDLIAYAYGDWWQAWEISADAIIEAYLNGGYLGDLDPLITDLLFSLLKDEDHRLQGIVNQVYFG